MSTGQQGSNGVSGFSRYVRIDPQTWTNVTEQSRARFAGLKPLGDFFDKNRFRKPSNIGVFTSRLNYNLTYYQNNYILIVLIVTAYQLLTNLPLLLIILFLLGGWKFISSLPANQPTTLLGVQVTSRQLWPAFAMTGVLLLWFSDATGTIFWMVSLCALIIGFHAGMMEPPVEASFAEQQV
ncbi:uncharacterized protein SPPG_07443 [Spizellomyces punctatus DAOM BR117]|uniref:PRA1 family protein n=1 Tax=Spizellomyces punctatus (strain DAOM BR117) TaxID=645134 RepID=A0A0L0H6B8_SPIPD|nr:uncharacterized protein SPPG_07443 [Spizellomyces punctatus DAOM BR117]KNC97045.1 hypothetical protein SPPG_07443 [Spizellomyces punctatus DAOM BR117]|eukprot:XP_016605085.1 hypothetical protein SPPG_07443 [Spizellomyces punctatus DAOM BR117]